MVPYAARVFPAGALVATGSGLTQQGKPTQQTGAWVMKTKECAMPKGYWISNSDVSDEAGLWAYRDANRAVMTRYGARFIVVHGQHEVVEGTMRPTQTVVEFPTYQAAVNCYHDPEYAEAAKLRHKIAVGNQVIVEGFEEPAGF